GHPGSGTVLPGPRCGRRSRECRHFARTWRQNSLRSATGATPAPGNSQAAPTFAETLSIVITPTHEYRRTGHHEPARLLKGLDATVNGLIGAYQRRHQMLETLRRDADEIDGQAAAMGKLSDHHLRERLFEFKDK